MVNDWRRDNAIPLTRNIPRADPVSRLDGLILSSFHNERAALAAPPFPLLPGSPHLSGEIGD
jgi:hypothetical protein